MHGVPSRCIRLANPIEPYERVVHQLPKPACVGVILDHSTNRDKRANFIDRNKVPVFGSVNGFLFFDEALIYVYRAGNRSVFRFEVAEPLELIDCLFTWQEHSKVLDFPHR